jgi:GNAT superfamily N-acetyltransferase
MTPAPLVVEQQLADSIQGTPMELTFGLATGDDAEEIAALANGVAADLTARYGTGHWSTSVTVKAVLHGSRNARRVVARDGGRIVATLRLATKKPWAIDPAYFAPVKRCLYLTGMAVHPPLQHQGIGRRLLAEADSVAVAWPADAIRLDAYDAPAGAVGFYAKCGYRETGRVTYRSSPLVYFERLL